MLYEPLAPRGYRITYKDYRVEKVKRGEKFKTVAITSPSRGGRVGPRRGPAKPGAASPSPSRGRGFNGGRTAGHIPPPAPSGSSGRRRRCWTLTDVGCRRFCRFTSTKLGVVAQYRQTHSNARFEKAARRTEDRKRGCLFRIFSAISLCLGVPFFTFSAR